MMKSIMLKKNARTVASDSILEKSLPREKPLCNQEREVCVIRVFRDKTKFKNREMKGREKREFEDNMYEGRDAKTRRTNDVIR